MRLATTLLALAAAPLLAAEDPISEMCRGGDWSPAVEFTLEDGGYRDALLWVSGWSYALTEVGNTARQGEMVADFCLPACGRVESRVLLAILNHEHRGETVSSEVAAETLWREVREVYKCQR